MATIIGTFENESLIGTAFDDDIFGDRAAGLSGLERGGDDRIFGLAGEDFLYGDAGGATCLTAPAAATTCWWAAMVPTAPLVRRCRVSPRAGLFRRKHVRQCPWRR